MNTTNYILELLIAGICTFLWIGLFFLAFWGDEISLNLGVIERTDKIILSLALAPIIYVIGIISDRLVDQLFDRLFKLKPEPFSDKNDYRIARSKIYINSDTLTNLFEYGRMRIRICRNWTFNGILIWIASLAYLWSQASFISEVSTKIQITIGFSILMILSIITSFFAWKSLNKKEIKFLEIQEKFFDDREK